MPDDQNTNADEQDDGRDAADQQNANAESQDQDDIGEKGQAAIRKERDARRTAERDLKALKAELATLKGRDQSDEEKREADRKALAERADTAEQKLRSANARVAISEAATKANAISVKAVIALVRDDLEFDDDGEPMNVESLIRQARKEEPQLFRASGGSGDGGKGAGKDTPANVNDAIRRALGRTS